MSYKKRKGEPLAGERPLFVLGTRSMSETTSFSEKVNTNTIKPRTRVYIDGFNWYYGVFRHKPGWKWLNIKSWFDEIRPHEDIQKIYLFSAKIDPDVVSSSGRNRQELYWRALQTVEGVKIVEGQYQKRTVRCGARCLEEYQTAEEKKTDVNIAVQMINDSIKGSIDSIVLVSGDSDLQPAVIWIKENHPNIKLTVYIPAIEEERENRNIKFYAHHKIECRWMPLKNLDKHQLPDKVPYANQLFIERPASWKK
ncbi:MAG: NYN domain-containing protein [Verrucomicrobiales bacterium]|jgi:uncharacterized LabA/DUF88 family protein|nr:NYN domain-containing protein [Verrucomicrobiales bacterium]